MRILTISDLHTDFRENWHLVEQISSTLYHDDILIVAGDIADNLEIIKRTLSLLRSKFKMVCYTPGNHELWVRNEGYDSIEKLFRILRLCHSLDVQTMPAQVNNLWIVPLFSWYDPEFDSGPADKELDGWADFHFCKWPEEIHQVYKYFIELNEPNIRPYEGDIISFSHFLPRLDLLPEKENLKFKSLGKVAGCDLLEEQIREMQSSIHVFGHSHINRDCVIGGVRYIQNALSYPRERATANLYLKEVWDFTTTP
jgi:predicted phosphodiesterase